MKKNTTPSQILFKIGIATLFFLSLFLSNNSNAQYSSTQPKGESRTTSPMSLTFDTNLEAGTTVTLPLRGTVNVSVDWGDGTIESFTTDGNASHTYSAEGIYTVSISGSLSEYGFGNRTLTPNSDKLIAINDFGTIGLTSLYGACAYTPNLTTVPANLPSSVTKINYLFNHSAFNGSISGWDVSNITQMVGTFGGTTAFNQDISNWDVSNVIIMSRMFSNTSAFNQDIGSWNVGKVENMFYLFKGAAAFNQDIGDWNVSKVTDMGGMFFEASLFNQDIGDWDVSKVEYMRGMFDEATAFDQDISSWNIAEVVNFENFFKDAGLSTANYDALLNSWSAQNLQASVTFHAGNSSFSCASASARANIISTKSWTITDGGGLPGSITAAVTNIGASTATVNGSIDCLGTINPTAHGFCWSTTTNPTLADNLTDLGAASSTGAFSTNITALNYGTTYYVRSFVTNAVGTTYGNEVSFTTSEPMILTFDTNLETGTTVTLPLRGTVNVSVDWGDGTTENITTSGNANHTYSSEGIYTVTISGSLSAYGFENINGVNSAKLTAVGNFGELGLTSLSGAFASTTNLTSLPANIPSGITDLSYLFSKSGFNGPIGTWDVSNVTNMKQTFSNTTAFNQDISSWDMGSVTTMLSMFFRAQAFNQDIGNWNVENVTNMDFVFDHATAFNQDIGNWNTSKVTVMAYMFRAASAFDQDIGDWDVSNVYSMSLMFSQAGLSSANYDALLNGWSNQALNNRVYFDAGNSKYCKSKAARDIIVNNFNWNISDGGQEAGCDPTEYFITTWKTDNPGTSNATSITIPTIGGGYSYDVDWNNDGTFDDFGVTGNITHDYGTAGTYTVAIRGDFPRIHFNDSGDKEKILSIEQWGAIAWSSMSHAFSGCKNLVGNATDKPDLSAVTDMSYMFASASAFNQDISSWNLNTVTNMNALFLGATAFNQDISSWDVRNVTNMAGMFYGANSFDQNLGSWNVEDVLNMDNMFKDMSLSSVNYTGLLTGWASQNLQSNINFHGGNSTFDCSADADRASIISNYNWTITDGGSQPQLATLSISKVGSTTASSTGLFHCLGTPMPTAHGVVWNTTGNPTTADNVMNKGAATNTGQFIVDLSNLSPGTTYYLRAYATNASGTIYGNELNFTTGIPMTLTFNTAFEARKTVTLPLRGTVNVVVEWGDGSTESFTSAGDKNHTYSTHGIYTVNISGSLSAYGFETNSTPNAAKLTAVGSFGDLGLTSLEGAFKNTTNLNTLPPALPSSVTSLKSLLNKSSFNASLSSWDVSNVTSMVAMFNDAKNFNQDISNWDVSNVTNMGSMFELAERFNQNIGNWDVGAVTNMDFMFSSATDFNQDISSWDVSKVTGMAAMFANATAFDQDIGSWNVANVSNFGFMLVGTSLSTANYDALLIGWASQTLKPNMSFQAGNNKHTCAADAARASIISNYNWTITDGGGLPGLSTLAVTNISSNSATINGDLFCLGNPNATTYGFCWNTTGNPTISDNLINKGAPSITGPFSANLNSLLINTTYYVRTFATNANGTSYGNEVNFVINCANPSIAGTIASDQQICEGSIPNPLTSTSLPSGYAGNLEYKWQSSTTNGSSGFSDIANSNSTDFAPAALNTTTWFKRLARVDCSADWTAAVASNVMEITVEPTPIAGSLVKTPNVMEVCENSNVSAVLTPGTGGNGTDETEYRTNNGSWSGWLTYSSGMDISTTGLSAVEIRSRRLADQCAASAYVTVSWNVEATPFAGVLTKTPNVMDVCENSNVSAVLTPGTGGNSTDEFEYRTNNGSWSGWLTYTSGMDISTTGLSAVEIRSRRLADQCAASAYVTVSWNVEATPFAGVLAKTPNVMEVCENSNVSAVLTPGTGGNGTDETEYRTNSGSWSGWLPYVSGSDISTTGLSAVEIRSRRLADQCAASAYVTVSWNVEATPFAGSLAKTPNVMEVCENSNVSAVLTPGTGGNGTDEIEYRTNSGSWSGWLPYVSGSDISTTGLTAVEIRSRRLADQCDASDYVTVSWNVEATPIAGSLDRMPDVLEVCENSNVSATLTPGNGGNSTDETEYRTCDGTWSGWLTYVSGTDISTTGLNVVEIRTRRLADQCDASDYVTVSWNVEATPIAGSLDKMPDVVEVCENSNVSATLTPGNGGNSTDETEYRTNNGTWSGWLTYVGGTDISTTGLSSVEIRTRRLADHCDASDYVTVSWSVEATPFAGVLDKMPDVVEVCENTNVSAILTPGNGGNSTDETEYRTFDGTWSGWLTYVSGTDISTTGLNVVEIRTRRLADQCDASDYATVSWNVEAAPIAGSLDKMPDVLEVCENSKVSATLTPGTGGNESDETEYRTFDGTWSGWLTYVSGTDISTTGLNVVEIRTRRLADQCDASDYVTVSWNVEATPLAGSLDKMPDVLEVCENSNVSATLTPGNGGNSTDETEYRTFDGTWSGWLTYVSGTDISTTGLSSVEIRTRRLADQCDASDYVTVSWNVEATPIAGSLDRMPDVLEVCENSNVSATLTPGNGGNSTDETEYRTFDGTWSGWLTYVSGTDLSTTALSSVEIRTRRLADQCDASDYVTVSWNVEATPIAGVLNKMPDVLEVCENSNVSATLTPGNGGNRTDETEYRTFDGTWSGWLTYVSGTDISTTGLSSVEIRTRRLADQCDASDYVTVSWNVEATPFAGVLDKMPDVVEVCENSNVSASLTPGSGGNESDETEYRTFDGAWSGWLTYVSGTDISTTGLSAVEIRTRRLADQCDASDYVTVSWNVEATPIAGVLSKMPDVLEVCENSNVSATLTPGNGGNSTDETEYRTNNGTWSGWLTYVSGTDISTTGLSSVEIRTRRLADQCDASDYVTVSWNVEATPIAGSLVKIPAEAIVCENTILSANFTAGAGGNGLDELEYRRFSQTWSAWMPYASGQEIQTANQTMVEIRTRRLADQCDASDYVSVSWEIQLKPTAYAGPNDLICASESYTLSDATANNFSSVLWTTSGDGYFDDPTIVQATYFPGNGDVNYGEVSLFLRADAIAPCDVFFSDMIILDIQKLPTINAGANAAICETDTYAILDASAENFSGLLWTSSGSGSFNDATTLNPIYTPSTADRNLGAVELTLTTNSVSPCVNDFSDQLTLTLNPQQEVYVSISADQPEVCDGTTVNFVAQSTNAGDNPIYEWTVNGIASGENSEFFSFAPSDGDEVQLTLTSSLYCVVDPVAVSNSIAMAVNPIPELSVSINVSENDICAGSLVTYTAEPMNGGDNPQYSWFVNGVLSGANSNSFTYAPNNQDEVWVEITSNIACNEGETALSNVISMQVNPTLEAAVVISASNTDGCSGTPVSFTAEIENGGSNPLYEWTVNGVTIGSNSPSFSYVPQDQDLVQLTITSNANCVLNTVVSSNIISMDVTQSVEATATISIDSNPVCEGDLVSFAANTSNGGTNPGYIWFVNGSASGSSQPSFNFVPENGDEVSLLFISNANCVTNSPVTSNTVEVTVEDSPIVSWESFEPGNLCIFWEPVALTGGMPEGGSYEGEGVIDNVFYPAMAGIGAHEITYTYATPLGCAGSASYTLFVDVCTGLAEQNALKEVVLYPNPTRNQLNVSFGETQVEVNSFVVVDMLGETVMNMDSPEASNFYAFDLTELKPGAYLLRIITDERVENKTFIVRD